MSIETPGSQRLWHLVLTAVDELEPCASTAGRDLAVAGLREWAARSGAIVLAFACLPAELDLLVAADEAALEDLRQSLSRRLNRLLGRRGRLLSGPAPVALPAGDWIALAEAIEQRVVAAGLAPEPAASPAASAHADHAEWLRQPVRGPAPERPAPPVRTIGEVIRVADAPTVVDLSVIERLAERCRAGRAEPEELRDWVARWYLDEPRTRSVVRTVFRGLAGPTGAGFFVTGLYGSGKSHLLAVAALTTQFAAAREELFAARGELIDLAAPLMAAGERLVVIVPLDQISPTVSLEEAIFGAAERELRRHGFTAPLAETGYVLDVVQRHLLPEHAAGLDAFAGESWSALAEREPDRAAAVAGRFVAAEGLPYTFAQTRVERLGRLLEAARELGRTGVVLILDELSVFLAARPRPGLHADASLLQFLGQRTALSPLWVLAALQRQIEDVGDIEHYTLRQIKDRFETRLTLPLAAGEQVLARKVLPRRGEAELRAAVDACLREWTAGRRLPDLTASRLRAVYPLHPLTFACLEACAERFLARTRSIIEFARARVAGDEIAPGVLDRPATALVCPDELWDQFVRDIAPHGDLKRHHDVVYTYFERHLPQLVGDESELGRRLIKLLLVLRLAGLERSVRDLAAALLPAVAGREERVAGLLERLRAGGAYLTVERRTGEWQDVYRVDLEFDVNETIRRRVRSLAATLTIGDGRLTATAIAACDQPRFPLATTLHPRSTTIDWLNLPRHVFLALRDLRTVTPHELRNRAALLASLDCAEGAYLYLAEPQRTEAQADAFAAALAEVDGRWSGALVAWLPRAAEPAEWTAWVEDAAHLLLLGDPTLAGGPDGEALVARLREDEGPRRERLRELLERLYREGSLLAAAGRRPLRARGWREALAELAAEALARVCHRAVEVAPPGRAVQPGDAETILERLLVPGATTAAPGSVLALAIEALARPLGVIAGEAPEYRVEIATGPLVTALLERLGEATWPLAAVEAWLGKSAWGLVPEQARVLLAALLRRGYLTGFDAAGQPAVLRAPLRASVASCAVAGLLDEAAWTAVDELARRLHLRPAAYNLAGQQSRFESLVEWRAAALAASDECRAGLRALSAAWGHEPPHWRTVEDVLARLGRLAAAVKPGRLPRDGLLAVAEVAGDGTDWAEVIEQFDQLRRFVRHELPELLVRGRELTAMELPAGPLHDEREALLAELAAGAGIIAAGETLRRRLTALRRRYVEAYVAWHGEVWADERFRAYDALRTAPALRLLGNLSRLTIDLPDSADALLEEIRRERRKQCRQTDLPRLLADRLTCPECGLLPGETVPLLDPTVFADRARRAIDQILSLLAGGEFRRKIDAGLRDLPPDDHRVSQIRRLGQFTELTEAELLAATSFAVIDLLNTLLAARPVARRSLGRLTTRLVGKHLTRGQAAAELANWLDPDQRLADDDLLAFED